MKPISDTAIRECIENALTETFQNAFSLSLQVERTDEPIAASADRLVGSVQFDGDVSGALRLDLTASSARVVAKAGADGQTDTELDDAGAVIGKLAGIAAERLKAELMQAGIACGTSTPAVSTPGAAETIPDRDASTVEVRFRFQNELMRVGVGLKQTQAPIVAEDAAESAEAENGPDHIGREVDRLKNLDVVMEIPLTVTVELGRTKRRINDLLNLDPGSVVELTQLEGEPVDIRINRTLIARGVVVVEKEKYGIRISEIVSRRKRIDSLR